MKDGLHKLTVPEYNALDRARGSYLKKLYKESPKHLRHDLDAEEEIESDALAIGSALHTLVLEPETYAESVVVYDETLSRKSVAYDRFASLHPDQTIILAKEEDMVKNMATAVRNDPVAGPYFDRGCPEMSLLWTDPATGLECKARVDWLDAEKPLILELKTARDAVADKFARQSDDLLYQLSWAMYRIGFHAITGVFPDVVTVVVEKADPWDVVVYSIEEEAIEAGTTLFREAMFMYSECKKANRWPGKGKGRVQPLELKPWAKGMPQVKDLEDVSF